MPTLDAGVTAVSAPSGAVTFDANIPLAIGRKGVLGGTVINEPDQLNGAIDSVWLSVSYE